MPAMNPLATAGAAPSTIIKMMALLVTPKTMIPSGYHSTDGMVCMPVIRAPMPARRTFRRATAVPTTPPMITTRA
jgi:hypothetical protein